ncbi:MAG TPA: cbb3-type cytochrome c oxidase subunit I [Conexivisphaerales archaeon]|nr:cbb3-type cytochrome c oxidase subunit I [Conexivisphaerales archaeon]
MARQAASVQEEWEVPSNVRRLSFALMVVSFVNFIIAGSFALLMRTDQAGVPATSAQVFYQLLTAHGLGMFVGWQFPFAYGIAFFLLSYFLKRPLYSYRLALVASAVTLVSFYLNLVSIGLGFAAGWYYLFPLPFYSAGAWSAASAALFLVTALGAESGFVLFAYVALRTVYSTKLPGVGQQKFYAQSSLYRFIQSVGLDSYMPTATWNRLEPFPIPVIGVVVSVLVLLFSTPSVMAEQLLGLYQIANPPFDLNNLLAKNLFWLYGHPIVYFAFFIVIGLYYFMMSTFSNRSLPSERWARAPWPLLLVAGVGVYSHHLFMDVNQPLWINLLSQWMSYLIGFASGLTVFALIAVMWRSRFSWNTASMFIVASIAAWIIGGFIGEEQGTIAFDVYEHNTYVVVAHFHFNALAGIMMASFGALYFLLPKLIHRDFPSAVMGRIHFWTSFIGSFGMSSCFLALGLLGAPRREANVVLQSLGFTTTYAIWLDLALIFALIIGIGQLPFLYNLYKVIRAPKVREVAVKA